MRIPGFGSRSIVGNSEGECVRDNLRQAGACLEDMGALARELEKSRDIKKKEDCAKAIRGKNNEFGKFYQKGINYLKNMGIEI